MSLQVARLLWMICIPNAEGTGCGCPTELVEARKLVDMENAREVLLDEVVAQARDSCHCTRCDFCTALAALDKYDGYDEDES